MQALKRGRFRLEWRHAEEKPCLVGDILEVDEAAALADHVEEVAMFAGRGVTLKANAVALCEVGQLRLGRSWKEDKDLMAFLKSL